jgi:hypothetical protein
LHSQSQLIRGVAGHPVSPGTPGFPSPVELGDGPSTLATEHNPFGEFTSVTKSYNDDYGVQH